MRAISGAGAAALAGTCCVLSGCGGAGGSDTPDHGNNSSGCEERNDAANTPAHDKAAKRFDIDAAVMHAELATAAYCGSSSQKDEEALRQWKCGAPCEKFQMAAVRVVTSDDPDGDAYAYVARTADNFTWGGGRCILGFRGTTNVAGWVNNLLSAADADLDQWTDVECAKDGTSCKVGIGWIRIYHSYSKYIKGNLTEMGCGAGENSLTVTGHSLGGAQAGLAMLDLKTAGWDVLPTYNFGSPRIGDEVFQEVFASKFDTPPLFRITHYRDPVPHVPNMDMGYKHLNMEVYFDKYGKYQISDGSGEDLCMANQWGDSIKDILKLVAYCGGGIVFGSCDHLSYMETYTKHPMTGEACSYPSELATGETVV